MSFCVYCNQPFQNPRPIVKVNNGLAHRDCIRKNVRKPMAIKRYKVEDLTIAGLGPNTSVSYRLTEDPDGWICKPEEVEEHLAQEGQKIWDAARAWNPPGGLEKGFKHATYESWKKQQEEA